MRLSGLTLAIFLRALCLAAPQETPPKPKEPTEAQKLEIESGILIVSE